MGLKNSFEKIFCFLLTTGALGLMQVAYAQEDASSAAPGDLVPGDLEAAPEAAPTQESATHEEAAPVVAGETAPSAETPAPASSTSNVTVESVRKGKTVEERRAGEFRLKLAVQRPTFDEKWKCYEEMYGSPTDYPMLSADWYFIDAFATVGLGVHGGYYSDRGHPLAQASNCDGESYSLVKDSKESFTFIPIQGVATLQVSPFSGRWITFEAWGGVEWLYFSNARVEDQSSTTTTSTSTTASTSSEAKQKSVRGEKVGTVVGASASILLNPLDQQTVASMRRSMGFGYVYLTPGIEIVSAMKKDEKRLSFGRTSYSLGFTFETF